MPRHDPARLPIYQRRSARHLAYRNGLLWALGNGMASTTLVIYLALDLGAGKIGLGIAMILAARHVVGVLRLGAPMLIGRFLDRKRFCLITYLASTVVLLALPLAASPGLLPSANVSLAALVVLWCTYHLLEYLGTIALWSWLADLVPGRIRGRFLGRRERWMVAGNMAAMLATGWFTWWLPSKSAVAFFGNLNFIWWGSLGYTEPPRWMAYAIAAIVGTGFLMASLVPLARMPRVAARGLVQRGATWRSLGRPLADPRFRRLILFGCWFSFFNGVTQAAQGIYPAKVLGFSLLAMLVLQTAMRLGQLSISPTLGRAADRWGNRSVMMVCLLLVALGPLFYLMATPERRWWLASAWAVWVAYAGINVCLPNLMLKLSPSESNTAYFAGYYTIVGLCYAASTLVGGALVDLFRDQLLLLPGGVALDFYQYNFLVGWITRSLGVCVLLWVREGKARNER